MNSHHNEQPPHPDELKNQQNGAWDASLCLETQVWFFFSDVFFLY